MTNPEPVETVEIRWRCPFCNKGYASKYTGRSHIEQCWHNPAVQTCRTCGHWGGNIVKGQKDNDCYLNAKPDAYSAVKGCPVWTEIVAPS